MKEDNKTNPQYTNINYENNMNGGDKIKNREEQSFSKGSSENPETGKDREESNFDRRLEDKPGAFLLKETAEDENSIPDKDRIKKERDDLDEDITEEDDDDTDDDMFNDDELYLEPFGDEDYEPEE